MQKTIFLICLSAVMMLHGADKLKVNKPDASSQLYELAGINNLTFTDPGTAKLKIKKPDGSEQLFNLSEISNLSFNGSSEIEKAEFFKKLGIGLVGNYPNPFNPTTTVNFTTSNTGLAKVEVFNQTGQLVATLHDGNLVVGNHSMQWNAQNASAGTYFVRVSLNGETVSNKMLLVK
jgi:hypothetical protein